MIIVQKYGGTSLADFERMENVARRIIAAKEAGNRVVVVLSAQGKHTDELVALAEAANPRGSKRERDLLLATGEQVSVTLMALVLQRLGHGAISLNARQAGIFSTSDFGAARIKKIETERILAELEMGNIVIITGFQGEARHGELTTLGRGGSDTTAVALAAALKAHACEIYTDVEGVYSADPRLVANAKKLPEISYDEMLELAALGAQVLQKRSVGLAKKYGVRLAVRSAMSDAAGTIVKEGNGVEGNFVSGVVNHDGIVRITISGVKDAPGVWYKVFDIMNDGDIAIDFVQQKKRSDGTKDISFTLDAERLDDAKAILAGNTHRLNFTGLAHDDHIAKLSVVSTGMATNPGVPSLMFEALFDAGINIDSISTSEIRVSVLIDKKEAARAAAIVHAKFFNGR
ncbi:MAG: aspartate kinase [Clostridiales bacterium]|jgi:aspartate kinase|nr:aspartate kinase [Clostridiales bacterium]